LAGRFVPDWALEPTRILAFVLLAGNWYSGEFGWTKSPAGPLWSISIEEQFYLVMPPVAKVLGKPALVWLSTFTIVVAYVSLWWLGQRHVTPDPTVWANSLVQFQFFGAGCILATALHGSVPTIKNPVRALFAVASLGLWLFAVKTGITLGDPVSTASLCEGYLLALVGTVLLFIAFLGTTARFPKGVLYLGKISYGLYVFHLLMMYLVGFTRSFWDGPMWRIARGIVSLILTIALATLSYEFFEKPFLRLKKGFTFIPSRAD
jgi:peptidoglycan/LPS O-acetylase OafA/YrhL